jgi:hypothetical protein
MRRLLSEGIIGSQVCIYNAMQYVIHFDTNNACPNVAKRK